MEQEECYKPVYHLPGDIQIDKAGVEAELKKYEGAINKMNKIGRSKKYLKLCDLIDVKAVQIAQMESRFYNSQIGRQWLDLHTKLRREYIELENRLAVFDASRLRQKVKNFYMDLSKDDKIKLLDGEYRLPYIEDNEDLLAAFNMICCNFPGSLADNGDAQAIMRMVHERRIISMCISDIEKKIAEDIKKFFGNGWYQIQHIREERERAIAAAIKMYDLDNYHRLLDSYDHLKAMLTSL